MTASGRLTIGPVPGRGAGIPRDEEEMEEKRRQEKNGLDGASYQGEPVRPLGSEDGNCNYLFVPSDDHEHSQRKRDQHLDPSESQSGALKLANGSLGGKQSWVPRASSASASRGRGRRARHGRRRAKPAPTSSSLEALARLELRRSSHGHSGGCSCLVAAAESRSARQWRSRRSEYKVSHEAPEISKCQRGTKPQVELKLSAPLKHTNSSCRRGHSTSKAFHKRHQQHGQLLSSAPSATVASTATSSSAFRAPEELTRAATSGAWEDVHRALKEGEMSFRPGCSTRESSVSAIARSPTSGQPQVSPAAGTRGKSNQRHMQGSLDLLAATVATSAGSSSADPSELPAVSSHGKKSIATYFQESFYLKRPNWRTGLTRSDQDDEDELSEYDDGAATLRSNWARKSKIVMEMEMQDDAIFCNNWAGTGPAVPVHPEACGGGAQGDEKRKGASEISRDEKLSSSSRPPAETERHLRMAAGRSLASQPRTCSSDSLDALGSASLASGDLDEEPQRPGDMARVVLRGAGRAKSSMSCKRQARRSKFAYWPLNSSSVSFSLGTSTSTSDRPAEQFRPTSAPSSSPSCARQHHRPPTQQECRPHSTRHLEGAHRSTAISSSDDLKFLLQRNLVAALLGAYILISLCIIVALMVPYFLSSAPTYSQVEIEVNELATATPTLAHQVVRDTKSIQPAYQVFGQASDGQVKRQEEGPEPRDQLEKQPRPPLGDQLSEQRRKRLILARLKQAQVERTKEIRDFQELWRVTHRRQCQTLKIPFCARSVHSMMPGAPLAPGAATSVGAHSDFRMSYDRTLLPNQFTVARQPQVERVLEKYEPLVDVRCYPLMPLFLCSIFAPKCIQLNSSLPLANSSPDLLRPPDLTIAADFLDRLFPQAKRQANWTQTDVGWARLVPPCRSLCKEALRKCTFFLEVLSLHLLEPQDCDSLPESADETVCVGQRELLDFKAAKLSQKCLADEFKCSKGECIPRKWRCDGFDDCLDRSDEAKCSTCETSSQFYCGREICIDKRQVCDGQIDCKDGRDERLCLRLSGERVGNSSAHSDPAGLQQPPRRLEAWNSTQARWLPVCGARWKAMPMSHEACQALGYTRANETLILFGPSQAAPPSSPQSPATAITTVRNSRSAPVLDHHVSYEREPQPSGDLSAAEQHPSLLADSEHNRAANSVAQLLHSGAQVGCDPKSPHLSSTVHLSCYNFQCGRSVTSYLTRGLDLARPQTVDQNVVAAAAAGAQSKDLPALLVRSTAQKLNSAEEPEGSAHQSGSVATDEKGAGEEADDEDLWLSSELDAADDLAQPMDGDSSAAADTKSPVSSRLVVGGIESMPGEFPYLAALHGGPDEVFFCGGVLISANWLLTAAHCVGDRTQPDGWMVKVGVTRRIASPAFVRKLKVGRIIKHQHFDRGTHLNNDIALIMLDKPVDFNQYLRPICLPRANLRLGPDNSKDCVVVGFGKSRFSSDAGYLHVAHFANVPIVHQSVCSAWYAEQEVSLTEGMLCAGYSEGKRDACQGDSGSGLFCRHSNTNQFFVAGLVSFGIKCATPKLPGVYTSVPFYVDWIKETTRASGYPVA